ncbi:MAG TPA: hypothetical protein VH583_14010 [Vicinamibacterales bacterium]
MPRIPRSVWQLQTAVSNPNLVSPSDELFFLLEGQRVYARGQSWRMDVCGIYSTDQERWVQLNLVGPAVCGVTLRAGFLDADAVIDLVRDWLDDTLSSEREGCIVGHAGHHGTYAASSDRGSSSHLTM